MFFMIKKIGVINNLLRLFFSSLFLNGVVVYVFANNDPFTGISFSDSGVEVGHVKDSTINLLDVYNDYGSVLNFFGALIIVTAMVAMIYRFYILSRSGDNEQARKKAMRGILATGIGLITLGSFMLIANAIFGMFL